MKKTATPRCAACDSKTCAEGNDCFETADEHRKAYEQTRLADVHRAASAIEARHYCQEPRLAETILFAQELGCKKIGLAFCIGMSEEAKVIQSILAQHFEVLSVCCKVSGIEKDLFSLEHIRPGELEVMCNPAGQADLLNEAQTELNIICGLCVGHDAIFTMQSDAPVTTLVAKDRVMAHNPVGAIYCPYVRRKFMASENSPQ